MGNSASGDKGRYRHGYHVLMVKEDTPASRAGLRPYFDYIMGINGIRLNKEDSVLRDQMDASEDKPVILDVYSTRDQALRKIELTPAQRRDNNKDGYIGCSIRFCLFDIVGDVVWHILDVASGSPAMEAGLCAYADYIIGTPLGIMRGEKDFYDLVEDYIEDELPLHVYNANTNEVREVIIVPREDWGGQGLLGCDVGFGYLHRLPKELDPSPRQTNGTKHAKEKNMSDPVNTNTEKTALDKKRVSYDPQQQGPPADNSTAKEIISEKTAYHDNSTHDEHNSDNIADTRGPGTYESTAPTPMPAQLETIVSNDQQPMVESVADNSDDDEEEVTTVTVPEQLDAEQISVGTVATAAAEPVKSPESASTPTPVLNHSTEGESKQSEDKQDNNPDVSETQRPEETHTDLKTAPDDPKGTPNSETPLPQRPHRPQAIAARMKPGIHGRGSMGGGMGARGKIGHDGFPRNEGRIPLQAVQAQAQHNSPEYRAAMEKKEREEKEADERLSASNESLNVQVLDNDDDSDNEHKSSKKESKESIGGRRRYKEEMNADFHEIVVEGMIRNMSLGSSIFPL
ncbi:Golgi reassembly-stacking protein 2 [Linnemannia zychae]|nr:Golgi reassembly-stacking protein 2 [Linnemannia zychae]